jgi:hypothetical protein
MFHRIPHPSPAIVLATLALFVALTGTAVAAGVVPLAKRALVADNAKKIQGQTSAQIVALASASSRLADDASHVQGKTVQEIVAMAQTKSVAGFFTIKQATFSMPINSVIDYTVPCDAGQKAVSGGSEYSQAPAFLDESRPSSDGTSWKIMLENPSRADGAFGNLFVVCVG